MWNKAVLILCASCVIQFSSSDTCQDTSGPYSHNSLTITCTNNTKSLPNFNKTVIVLKCLYCNIPVLDNTTVLINFRGETFNMSNSHIREIKAGAFDTFTNKTSNFIFENNEIDYIQPKVFNMFNAIDLINLKNSQISSLEAGVFEETSLSKLDLSLNSLSKIRSIFDGLKVNKLNLSNNVIKELPEDAFDKTTFWNGRNWKSQELDLSKNFIEKLVPNTFKSSTDQTNTIIGLYLAMNSISVIEDNTFSQLMYLRVLSLEGNKISTLYKNSFKGLTSLNDLILKKNLISNISVGLFGDLRHLEILDLSENRLSSLSSQMFTGLVALYKLNISNNDLKLLDPSHLFPLGNLVTLDVSATKLHDLKLEVILEYHFRLRALVINDNFWTCKRLTQMYILLNLKLGGFNYPTRHFDVPNLHGIACSRAELESYDHLSFEEFLNIISQDRVFEDIFDRRTNQDQEVPDSDVNSTINKINIIAYMFIVLTTIAIILFVYLVLKFVVLYLDSRNIIKHNNFTFLFAQKQDTVELVN